MQRLTPRKCLFKLPDSGRRLDVGGNTSIIYTTDDPNVLEMYTIEELKFKWWLRGLHIIDDYERVGEACYAGIHRERYGYHNNPQYVRLYLPVYRALVQRLDMPNKVQMKRVRQIQKAVQVTLRTVGWRTYPTQDEVLFRRWKALEALAFDGVPELFLPTQFIMDEDLENVLPDFGPGDFAVLHDEIVVLDPFHHRDLQPAFRLSRK